MDTFAGYIDSGFGLLGSEVDFLVATLIVIDLVLAGVFWAMKSDGTIMARFIKKVLYIGVFAYIIGNFAFLATIIFDSFSGLGLQATGTSLTPADLMRPGFIASTGFDAASPILDTIKDLCASIKVRVLRLERLPLLAPRARLGQQGPLARLRWQVKRRWVQRKRELL